MKEKKGRLYKFYGKLTIRNKLLISCLPFVVLGYFLIFYSTTVIMFDQMKQMVYDQTEQNFMEKKKLVNTLLDNYNQATIKFLYYTDEVQEYLNTRQSVLSVEEQEKLTDMISYQIGSLITNNQDALMNVCIYNKYHYISSDGYDIYVGKNNFQNDELSFKFASGNDWWFHAKGQPGSHVIVKSKNEELPDRTFEEAGKLAAYYSKGRQAPKVEIDYTQKKNLRKPTGGKPGFVVYYTNYSLLIEPDITGLQQIQ